MALLTQIQSKAQTIRLKTDLGDLLTTNYCVCKDGNSRCLSGNLISFRVRCYVGEPATCSDYGSNCKNSN